MDWVAVGLSRDLRDGMAMPGKINNVDLAIWRSTTGDVHAWGDRCPHRGMRLSHGFVRGETLSCIYHGWQYGEDGGCTSIPAHPNLTPPKTICAKTYACQQSDGLIWVALDDVATSPPSVRANTPVRSLPVSAPLRDIAAHFGDSEADVIKVGPSQETTLVLQPTDAKHCIVHALSDGDPKTVSRWLETQRAIIEKVAA
mgnify:CR=1 FL=1